MSAPHSSATLAAALETLCGADNAQRYAKKFAPLDASFHPPIKGYEALAFYVYSTGMAWYEQINEELWSGTPSSEVVVLAAVLNAALEKLPPYRANSGLVYRGYQARDLAAFLTQYEPNSTVIFPGFTSASFKEEHAFGGNILFIIRSLTARVIWFLAADYWEAEVLIPTDRQFRVVGVEILADRSVVILHELASSNESTEKQESPTKRNES